MNLSENSLGRRFSSMCFSRPDVGGGDFLMDQQPAHVIDLPDQAPWVAAEVLADNQRIAGDYKRFGYDVKRWLEGRP